MAHGLDLEPSFLAVARQKAEEARLPVTWHRADLLDLAAVAGSATFQLVTCLGQTLPHLLEEAQWLSFFRQARAVLRPGGCLAIQAVHDAALPPGHFRELPPLRIAAGTLERRRIMVSETLASFETLFTPVRGVPAASRTSHRRMDPGTAAGLLRDAGLEPEPPVADEAGRAFEAAAPGWLLIARRV